MGSFDGAETCELVESYLLSHLPTAYRNDIGLYRDDGLSAFNIPPRDIEKIKKEVCKVFNDNKLKLTIEANKKCVNFLDITFDFRSGTFKPYTKPGNAPLYVNVISSHPPCPFYVESLKLLINAFREFHPTSNRSTQALAHTKKL